MKIPISAWIALIFVVLFSWFMLSGKKNIGGPYYRDLHGIYYDSTTGQSLSTQYNKLIGADEKSFKYLGGAYAKDESTVYYKRMDFKADAGSFECISLNKFNCSDYGKDKDSFYYTVNKIPDVDRETFKVISDTKAIDKNYSYDGARRVKIK